MVTAQKYVRPKQQPLTRSFAVITDVQTWKHCQKELVAYQQMLGEEQLPTYIIYKDWKKPEEVKKVIQRLYTKNHLEGVVFVGDVPIAMIRKAQHLTSAFKMNEKTFPWNESSVPSDRFYDDLHLQFDYLKQDSIHKNFFYYNLAVHSPQEIHCDIYSGRIKPVDNGVDPYQQISNYLLKTIEQHRSQNKLDQFFSYTGEGSYSNSLTAWTPEAFTIREQMPGVFDKQGRARFMRYSFYDYPKETVMNMMRRNDLDLAIFHEHGTPDRQYISASPATEDLNAHIEKMKADKRSYIRRWADTPEKINEYIKKQKEEYGLGASWFKGHDDPKVIEEDSLLDLKTGIILSDVTMMKPNARMTIFDACYNGDFREKDYIAGRYIFSEGKSVVCFANSVNVLQDKQANEMLGLLGLGARVGQWAQLTNILESHVIGDPTFRFTSNDPSVNLSEWISKPYSEAEALRNLDSKYADVQNLAMHQLYRNGYTGISDLLVKKYRTSPFAVVRYTALALLINVNDKNLQEILKESINDSNEFIRRTTVRFMAFVGLSDYVPLLVKEYAENYFSERERFDIGMKMRVFDEKVVKKAVDEVMAQSYVTDKKELAEVLLKENEYKTSADEHIFDKTGKKGYRISYINSLKNENIHASVDGFLKLILDNEEEERVRCAMLESLAWFKWSYRRHDIMNACEQLMHQTNVPAGVRECAERTYYRLK